MVIKGEQFAWEGFLNSSFHKIWKIYNVVTVSDL